MDHEEYLEVLELGASLGSKDAAELETETLAFTIVSRKGVLEEEGF